MAFPSLSELRGAFLSSFAAQQVFFVVLGSEHGKNSTVGKTVALKKRKRQLNMLLVVGELAVEICCKKGDALRSKNI